jgi:hypothetical protein
MKSNTFLDNKGFWSLLSTIHTLIWSQPRCPHYVSLLALHQTFPAIRAQEEGNSHTYICSFYFVISVGVSWLCLQSLLHIVCQIFPDMEKEIKGTMEEYQKLLLESHLAIEKLSKRKTVSTTWLWKYVGVVVAGLTVAACAAAYVALPSIGSCIARTIWPWLPKQPGLRKQVQQPEVY